MVTYSQKFEAIRWITDDPQLRDGSKLVGIRLLIYQNHRTLQCNPSQERLARDLGRTERSIRTAIRQLRSTGYITDVRISHARVVNQYELWLPTGKSVHGPQENPRAKDRNADSSKEERKEEKKEEEIGERKRRQGNSGRHLADPLDRAKLALEKEIQKHFSDCETGWQVLQNLSSAELEAIGKKIVSGEQSAKTAVIALLRNHEGI